MALNVLFRIKDGRYFQNFYRYDQDPSPFNSWEDFLRLAGIN